MMIRKKDVKKSFETHCVIEQFAKKIHLGLRLSGGFFHANAEESTVSDKIAL